MHTATHTITGHAGRIHNPIHLNREIAMPAGFRIQRDSPNILRLRCTYCGMVHVMPGMWPVDVALPSVSCLVGCSLSIERLFVVAGRGKYRPLQYACCVRLHSKCLSAGAEGQATGTRQMRLVAFGLLVNLSKLRNQVNQKQKLVSCSRGGGTRDESLLTFSASGWLG